MSRWLPAVALGALLALGAVAVLLAIGPSPDPSTAERSAALAGELRCPDCQGLSVADSPTAAAREIRRQIDELLTAGASDTEVRAHFTERYGEWILLAPSSPVSWVVPFVVVGAGVAGLAAWLLARPRPPASAVAPVSDVARRRLHEEVDALDG